MDYVTVSQAAEALGITPRAVRVRVARGELQAERISARLLMIPKAEVERWRGRGKLRPGPKPGSRRKQNAAAGT